MKNGVEGGPSLGATAVCKTVHEMFGAQWFPRLASDLAEIIIYNINE